MADIVNPTTPITVYCGENPAESAAITKTIDGSKNRMDVDATITPSTNPYGNGTPFHTYEYDADSDVGDVTSSRTVTTGKIYYIYHWGVSDNSYGTYELQIAGVTVDAFVNANSGAGQRGLNQVTYPIPLKATAGQVVRILKTAGLSNKIVATIVSGIEVSA